MDNLKKVIYELVDKSFDGVYKMDELKRKLVANLQNYLRERMDFIASLPTMDPLWTAQFDIIDNLINPILDDIRDERLNPLMKCPNLFLLFDGILRSEGIRAGGIAFEIKIFKRNSSNPDYTLTSLFKLENNQIKYEKKDSNATEEFPIAISLGTSGIQAFYGILENIIRNSGRHSNKGEIKKVVEYSNAIKEKKQPTNDSHPLKITIEFYYDWNDDYKEYKDDFIKVKIYDNMEGWEKEKDNKWVKYDKSITIEEIKTLLSPKSEEYEKGSGNKIVRDGRIIDDTGSTVQGNWGFKEMRICASFLRGIKIPDYEKQHTPPVIIAVPDKEDQNKASLGFEFYIPKVKNLLIVCKNLGSEINKEDLKNKGIYIEKDASKIIDLQNRGVFTHEFVAIDVDDDENKKFIQENSLLLPYKLFFISGQNENLDEIINLFKDIRYDLHIKNPISATEKDNLRNLIISKDELQQWLTQNGNFTLNNVQYQNCPPAERVYLEIYKRWNIYIHKNAILPKAGIYFIKKFEDNLFFSDLKPSTQELSENFLNNCKNNILLLHRYDRFDEIKDKVPLAIIPFAHGRSDPVTRTKVEISSKIQNYQVDFAYIQVDFAYIKDYLNIIEIGSSNVIILDERVFDEAKKVRNICGVNVNFALSWYLQNVAIFNLDKSTDDKSFKLTCYKVNPKGELNQPFDNPTEINFANSNSKNEVSQYLSQHLPEHFKNKVHFMIVHQSIISPKIGGKEKFKEFINSLPDEYKPWYVIITSGRGHPPKNDMPENTKFLDFSTLRNVVIDRPDKFLLTKTLSGLKEARE
jgi:hypothetical protein